MGGDEPQASAAVQLVRLPPWSAAEARWTPCRSRRHESAVYSYQIQIRIRSLIVPRYIWQRPGWPRWRWSAGQLDPLLQDTQRKQDFLAGLARALDADHLGLAVAELTARETVSTSAIEGVRLDPDEVRSSIMRRLG